MYPTLDIDLKLQKVYKDIFAHLFNKLHQTTEAELKWHLVGKHTLRPWNFHTLHGLDVST